MRYFVLIFFTSLFTAAFVVVNPGNACGIALEKAGLLETMRTRYAITESDSNEGSALPSIADAVTGAIKGIVDGGTAAPGPEAASAPSKNEAYVAPPLVLPPPAPAPPAVGRRYDSPLLHRLKSKITELESANKILQLKIRTLNDKKGDSKLGSGEIKVLRRDMSGNSEDINRLKVQLEMEMQRIRSLE